MVCSTYGPSPPNFVSQAEVTFPNAVQCKPRQEKTHLLLLHPVQPFPLDLVQEIEVSLVEVVNADVAVFSAACVALAGRVGGDSVEGTEVTTHTANLVLEDLVVETGLELTLAGGGGGNIHGGLTTSQDDEVLLRGNGSAVQRSVGNVGLDDGKILGRDELKWQS